MNGPQENFPHGLKGLVFDVDGVLFDSRDSNILFYNLIREALRLPPLSRQESDYCHMASVDEALQEIIPRDLYPEAVQAAQDLDYQERILPLLTPEPGLLDALRQLRQWQVPMAISTNRANSVEGLLRHFGMESFFAPLKTAGNCAAKPSPEGLLQILEEWGVAHSDIAFIGDSKVDELAAERAGVPFWAFRNVGLSARLHLTDFYEFLRVVTPLVERSLPEGALPSRLGPRPPLTPPAGDF